MTSTPAELAEDLDALERDLVARLRTMQTDAATLVAGTAPQTRAGRRARLAAKTIAALEAQLDALGARP